MRYKTDWLPVVIPRARVVTALQVGQLCNRSDRWGSSPFAGEAPGTIHR